LSGVKYLLDTNICIYIINERPKKVLDQFKRFDLSDLGVSSVTVAELAYGVSKSASARNRSALQAFLLPLDIAFFDTSAAMAYGDLRASLERKGQPIGPLDLQIAAHALSLNAVLVTNNVREFRKVTGLRVENWA
jgi:tRNA(fMet)-specific endonuclease VapC